jgi:hypothetical protein
VFAGDSLKYFAENFNIYHPNKASPIISLAVAVTLNTLNTRLAELQGSNAAIKDKINHSNNQSEIDQLNEYLQKNTDESKLLIIFRRKLLNKADANVQGIETLTKYNKVYVPGLANHFQTYCKLQHPPQLYVPVGSANSRSIDPAHKAREDGVMVREGGVMVREGACKTVNL